MRKLLLNTRKPGPIPVHEGTSSVWHLSPVLRWLRDERSYDIRQDLIELADLTMSVNVAATQVNFNPLDDVRIIAALRDVKGSTTTRCQTHA